MVLPVSAAVINEAALAARRHALRSLDAIHLASALRTSQAAPDSFAFVASDRELVRAAGNAGVVAINPEEPEALQKLKKLRGR
ncbi:MAG: hypothetical protein HY673_24805 [Chloroflexi bacterium]|nr:hypothetical protein [Chloroflexota bacterium]